jgi:hypothetical protein
MKKLYILLLLFCQSTVFLVNRHINKDEHPHKNLTGYSKKKLLNGNEFFVGEDLSYYYHGHTLAPIFLEFIDLKPMYCVELTNYIVEHFACEEKIQKLKSLIYTLSPLEVWELFNNNEYFNHEFILMLNDIYDKEEFLLIYKTRLTIEFLIFAFNIKEKSIMYQYSFFQNITLKQILNHLLDFIVDGGYLLEGKITPVQLEQFQKFLRKYIGHKSIVRMAFLNDLKEFKYFIDVFSKERANTSLSVMEQMTMAKRFYAMFPEK